MPLSGEEKERLNLQKKIKEIEKLEAQDPSTLQANQIKKLEQKPLLLSRLAEVEQEIANATSIADSKDSENLGESCPGASVQQYKREELDEDAWEQLLSARDVHSDVAAWAVEMGSSKKN
eukprot:gnl/MRDRNA2_/MRDRNA2_68143_c0_seq1.p1 gnl/MRDRNA2_/MRDRNA2_68143_c0~~gnl/MRDRNA2_/MRDRNA2_68143_c0_seq1.p1  ORF type:complete len:120 (+),score=36.73 gnl/MRDRNA2_/MRDRNA2_68143_c0_seq1:81-440(+)